MKNFLITGATNGIGKAIAELMISLDYHVILVGRNEVLMNKTMSEFKAKIPTVSMSYFICDFMDFKSVKKATTEIKKNYQSIDYIHLNAGALPPSKNAKTPFNLDYSMSVNFIGPLLFLEELIPLALNSESKTILHTTSLSARKKFSSEEINELHKLSRIRSYATSKLFANLSYFHYSYVYPELKFKLIDPGIVYTNVINYVIPKWLRFIAPLGHLITRMPIVVAKEVMQIIEKNDKITIGLYRKAKLIRHHPINEDTNLQKLAMSYAHSHYKGIE